MTVASLLALGDEVAHKAHVRFLLADLLSLNPLELLNHLQDPVEETKVELFRQELAALTEGRPLQYVIGQVNFYGNCLEVNESVLIPRFETEELVEKTLAYIHAHFTDCCQILDLGCGSGAIGLTLQKLLPNCQVTLSDISTEALEVTRKNAQRLKLEPQIIQSDCFENISGQYDIIISNPPYIAEEEEIEEIVKNYEPHLALYGGKDGLDCYRKIFKTISPHLKDKALIALEIGMTQKEAITDLAHQYLTNIQVICQQDMSGKDRMLFIFKNCV